MRHFTNENNKNTSCLERIKERLIHFGAGLSYEPCDKFLESVGNVLPQINGSWEFDASYRKRERYPSIQEEDKDLNSCAFKGWNNKQKDLIKGQAALLEKKLIKAAFNRILIVSGVALSCLAAAYLVTK